METRNGFIKLDVDTAGNKIFAHLPPAGDDGVSLRLIHAVRLTAGLGSNPVGLDRGWGESGEIMVFRRMGDKVILEVENQTYRADDGSPLEARAVRESFASSFVASAEIVSEDSEGLVIDLTDYLTGDSLNLVQHLKDSEQGTFTLAEDRTLVDTNNVFTFPDNTEIDVFLTLSSDDPGAEVSTTAANGRDVTLIQHHSFVRLPEDGYTPLPSDPRVGVIEKTHFDYSANLDEPIERRLARRYRLTKDGTGQVADPIVFYVDSGAPEPIKSALIEGASWWADAFNAAGYPNGYRVEELPEGAHPLDIRYNVIQWVHRQTRGWSYGGGISDPRTGEMLKGHVILGSLRVRQDRMIFEGLAGTSKTGTGAADDPVELALARIRQLSAHETGHALGFAHNFAASTYGKASVMDYPAPDIRVTDGALDFSHAYDTGVGSWDTFAATWLYGDLTEGERDDLVQDALARGLVYVADPDARSPGTGHPLGNIWDNGPDPVATLNETMAVRRIALDDFGRDRVKPGEPIADLNKVIVPIYLYHRYQTAAAAKLVGGMAFNYSLRGDGQPAAEIVAPERQRTALDAVLKTIEPATLDLDDDVLALLTPGIDSYVLADNNRELFDRAAYPAFDTVSAAGTAADMTLDILLDPRRIARLIEFHRRDDNQLGAEEMFTTIRETVMAKASSGRTQAIAEAVRTQYAFGLMDLAQADTTSAVKAAATIALSDLAEALTADGSAQAGWLTDKIEAFETRPAEPATPTAPAKALPPGGPIGMAPYETCWHCGELD
ncbi:zinc-dependent metalloprotease [Henriciella aquimarina]|uniref:zinc-dependent metalloprotease n=1 Tax=Henriciella aquimarina TaxID=545261 RepID=UPI0013020012|nr:zinc-dependent metalloprotease [Henriciella aquimarina]